MYGQKEAQVAANQYIGSTSAAGQLNQVARPTVSNTHVEAIERLRCCVDSIDALLAKFRGAQPECAEKSPEEMPSVMANAGKINLLSMAISRGLDELHAIIGE